MNDARQRFDEGRVGDLHVGGEPDGVDRRDRDVFREAAWQPGDAMLAIPLALVGVAARTILARRRSVLAHAVASLVDDHAIARREVRHIPTDVLDDPGDLVPENLRFLGERYDAAVGAAVVVRVTRDNVHVGSADPDRADTHAHLVRPRKRRWHIAHLEAIHARKHDGTHQRRLATSRSVHAAPPGNAYVRRLAGFISMLYPGALGGT